MEKKKKSGQGYVSSRVTDHCELKEARETKKLFKGALKTIVSLEGGYGDY